MSVLHAKSWGGWGEEGLRAYRKVLKEGPPKVPRYQVKYTEWAIFQVRCEKLEKVAAPPTKTMEISRKNTRRANFRLKCGKDKTVIASAHE